ncbi:hypothetical protein [Frankia sp. B2]|uniref:hypothetical protein n=1 Tax=Frankia sp. B2 TaxID=2541730 RepID=UPI00141AEBA4|nr:hypothetical protein [Frankia sp. B2]
MTTISGSTRTAFDPFCLQVLLFDEFPAFPAGVRIDSRLTAPLLAHHGHRSGVEVERAPAQRERFPFTQQGDVKVGTAWRLEFGVGYCWPEFPYLQGNLSSPRL